MISANDGLLLARQALEAYGLPEASCEWLSFTHNAVFAVRLRGRQYVLRLTPTPDQVAALRLTGELLVLAQLRTQGGLSVPEALEAPHHQPCVHLPQAQVSAVLFVHLPGVAPTPITLTPTTMQRIGAWLATLHNLPADHWQPLQHSAVPLRPRLDSAGLFGQQGLYPLPDSAAFSDSQQAVMHTVQAHTAHAMATLGEEPDHFGLIHGDLLLKNILFDGHHVRVLDFEFCGFGYFIYDLAPLLWQLKPDPRYPQLAAGLWEGYTAVRPLPPVALLETFIAARQVASLRWLANNPHNPAVAGKVPALIAQRITELQGFLDTGVLQRR